MVTARRIAWAAAAAVVVAPTVAVACPSCARASLEGATVYYVATALMLLTPFILVGGLVFWLRRKMRGVAVLAALCALPVAAGCVFEPTPPITADQSLGGVTVSAARINRGMAAYSKYCQPCHGVDGDGRGRSAAELATPPRDFRTASFKFAGATEGTLPQDADLAALVQKGLHGTAMLPWDVPDALLADVLQYIKTFSPEGTGWRDPDAELVERIVPGDSPFGEAGRQEAVDRGRAVYHGYASCHLCHPAYETRADINADRVKFKIPPTYKFRPSLWRPDAKVSESYSRPVAGDPKCDASTPCAGDGQVCRWGRCEEKLRLMPPDFLLNTVRSGSTPAELFRTIATGIPGTAMPAWKGVMADKDIWALATYVSSVVALKGTPQGGALKAKLMADTAPMQPPPPPAPPPAPAGEDGTTPAAADAAAVPAP